MVVSDIRELGTVLSIWAHPDDEAYLCGGIMAMAVAASARVVCLTATRGELGVTDPDRWPPEQLPAIREAELAACLQVLGVSEHRWLGYPDGGCAEVEITAAATPIADIIREIAPDTILTFPPDGQTGHPDHMAVHAGRSRPSAAPKSGRCKSWRTPKSGLTITWRNGLSWVRSSVIRQWSGPGLSASMSP